MDARREGKATAMANQTTVVRKSDRELVITHSVNAPARIVFQAWTRPELFQRWWVPKSSGMTMFSCQMDVRTGGSYRIELGQDPAKTCAFFGKYLEVIPNARIVWTNDESDQGAVTTVTFEENGGKTLVVFHELYPSKEALAAAIEGMEGGMPEQFAQLDEFLASVGTRTEQ
jgi:uncharacterized protein YndB with AHSA1/START domain